VVALHIPPLRERPEDIPVLARHFLDRFAERFGMPVPINPEPLIDRLAGHTWPGNVRELENAIERVIALSTEGELDLSLLPFETDAEKPTSKSFGLRERVEAYERGLIVESLKACRNNRSETARRLDVSRATLHDKLKKYGIAGDNGEGD
jgi:two-component system, NtrC family, response regulator HydG